MAMSSHEEIIDFASVTESDTSISAKINVDMTRSTTYNTTTCNTTTCATPATGVSEAGGKQTDTQQVDMAEYMQLVRKLRTRRKQSDRQKQNIRSAQDRMANLFAVAERTQRQTPQIQRGFDAMIAVVGPRPRKQTAKLVKAVVATEATLAAQTANHQKSSESAIFIDLSSINCLPPSASTGATRSQGEEVILSSSSNPRRSIVHHVVLSEMDESDLSFKLPEPLDSRVAQSSRHSKVFDEPQQPQEKQLRPPSTRAALSLSPLSCLRLREPVLSLAFDPAGRRLICVEPSRGIRFRSVASTGDDMNPTESSLLDWSIWARAVCVLSGGHLLVATPANVQLFKTDGTRVAVSERLPGVIGLIAFERSALALESWTNRMYVFELPQLKRREYHPLDAVQLQDITKPTAMCALRNLVAIASLNDTLRTFEIETGRLRQEIFLSGRDGPKELASCGNLGLLFVSMFYDRFIHIFRLNGGILEKTASFREPGMKPGPLAWMPVNGVLFCVTSQTLDARNCELRSYALHEAGKAEISLQALRPMDI